MGIKPNGERYLMPCKTWGCLVCAAIKKGKLLDQADLYFSGEPNVYFYTFTEQADSGRDIMADLKRFRKTLYHGLKERVPGTFNDFVVRWSPVPRAKAFYVKEFTKRGIRHVHMITTFYMSNEELTQRWRHATQGISDQARITTQNFKIKSPAGYMMKYMGKQLNEDKEQFYTGEYQFKKYERRTGFWKPDTIKRLPRVVWEGEPKEGDKVEVELGHKWNEESKYYRSWYDDLYRRWGEPFHKYMEYSTLNEIQQVKVKRNTISGEYDYSQAVDMENVPEKTNEDDRHLLRAAQLYLKRRQNEHLTRVKRQTEKASL